MILEVKNIFKQHHQATNSIQILKGLSFKVDKGEKLAIIGKSGSGKSTLLSVISGVDQIDQGEIWLNGVCLQQLNETNLTQIRSQSMGIVFQQFHLVSTLTALENIMLPASIIGLNDIYDRAISLLDQIGLKNRAHHFPHQLSGGEQQRVALARAMSAQPPVILADEPTGNLDQQTGQEVMSVLFDLVNHNKTSLILVTHDQELAQKCQKILKLQDGVLLEF